MTTTPAQLRAAVDVIGSQLDLIDAYIDDAEQAAFALSTSQANYAQLQQTVTAMASEIKDLRRELEWPRMDPKECALSSTIKWQHPQLAKFAALAGVARAYVIYQDNIEEPGADGSHDNGGALDVDQLTAALQAIPEPAPGLTPIGVLDWEGEKAEAIASGDPSAIGDALDALRLANEIRPTIRWGLYGFPLRLGGNGVDAWEAANAASRPLLEAKDEAGVYVAGAVVVTLYRHYRNNDQHAGGLGRWWPSNTSQVLHTLDAARDVADGRPVVAMVMDEVIGKGAMSDVDFEAHVRTIADGGADVICWWQQDHLVGIERGKATMRSLVRGVTRRALW